MQEKPKLLYSPLQELFSIICPTSPPFSECYVSNEVWYRMKLISFDRKSKAVFRYLSSFESFWEKDDKSGVARAGQSLSFFR